MECLERYRRGLIRETNRHLRAILDSADETAFHDFRVAIKRLSAIYRFLQQVDGRLPAKQWLKPCRGLFKHGGRIRDAQIAVSLIEESGEILDEDSRALVKSLQSGIRRDYRQFQRYVRDRQLTGIRLPTLAATGISPTAIRRRKPACIEELFAQILSMKERDHDDDWHRKRILLKRYHHLIDAFSLCPGQTPIAGLLKQVVLLEQLLGDWHDRVTTIALLSSRFEGETRHARLISHFDAQRRILLAAARFYLPGLESAWLAENPSI